MLGEDMMAMASRDGFDYGGRAMMAGAMVGAMVGMAYRESHVFESKDLQSPRLVQRSKELRIY